MKKTNRREPSEARDDVAQREGFLCGDGYRAVVLAFHASHSALPQSRLAAKRRTAAFCGRSVESLHQNKNPPPRDGLFVAQREGFEPSIPFLVYTISSRAP